MMKKQQHLNRLTSMLCVVLLSACGGGGGGDDDGNESAASLSDRHVGSWSSCVPNFVVPSATIRFSVSKVDDVTASFRAQFGYYNSADCSGTSLSSYEESGIWNFKGTRTVSDQTVTLVDATVVSDTSLSTVEPRGYQEIILITGDELFFGGLLTGTDGYPNALNRQWSLERE